MSPEYRYGFNGKEKDENGEWGDHTNYDYGFRIYNPGIGRFLSVDPLFSGYPWYTPYQFAGNGPIWAIDIDGLEEYVKTVDYTVNGDEPEITITFDEELNSLEQGIHEVHQYPSAVYQFVTHDSSIPQVAVKKSSQPEFPLNDYSIRDDKAYALIFGKTETGDRQNDLLDEFLLETGPTNSLFLGDHPMTEGVKEMSEVERLRFLVYDKYDGNIPKEGSYVDFGGDFGLVGLLSSGTNLPAQFVGSLTGDVFVDEKGENLVFVITDSKSRKSLLLRLGDEPEREDASWGGNTYQKYFWTEPIDKKYDLSGERKKRDKNGKHKPAEKEDDSRKIKGPLKY